MSQRIHDPTETGLPEYSTIGTLRETLEELKDGPDFHITVEIGGETDDGDTVQPGQSGDPDGEGTAALFFYAGPFTR